MISYEVSIGLIIISVILFTGSLALIDIAACQQKMWFILPLYPGAVMFLVSALAETNRVPFDLTEAESELVSGFNVEYSSMAFALFFLAEYCHIILMGALGVILFLGGVTPWKISFLLFLFIWLRATLPRVRYDKLMGLLWQSYLPLSLGVLILTSGCLVGWGGIIM